MVRDLPIFLGEDWIRTGELMQRYLSSDISLLDKTNRTLLENSGKKLRPMLCLLVAKAVGGRTTRNTAHFAAAVELLHNATLLHDDVVDGSDLRRGKPTVMSLLGGTASVLIGDYWLVKALESILDGEGSKEEVLRIFSWTLSALAEGEMLQLEMAVSGNTTENEYFRIIRAKTASLFETAALSGAVSVGASEEMTAAVREYARSLGLAFQIKDDILDYTGSELIGKPVGQDLLEQKITLPLLEAFAAARPEAEETVREQLRSIEDHPEYREQIAAFVGEWKGAEKAFERVDALIRSAKQALSPLPESEAKQWLVKLADYTGIRTK